MRKLSPLVIGKILVLLIFVPFPSNAIGQLALLSTGKDVLLKAIDTYNALEDFHKELVATGVERLTPGQGATLRKLDNIYWDLTDLKNDIKNWQVKEEQKELAKKIDKLMQKINKVHQKYDDYERFRFNNSFVINDVLIQAEPETIERFAESAISFNNDELPEIIKSMRTAFTGAGTLRDSVLSTLSHNKRADLMCIRNQSAQQFILELLRIVIDAEIKGLVVMLFAYDELAKLKGSRATHYYEYSRTTAEERFKERIDDITTEVKAQLAYASREVWRCDPQVHRKDVTYSKIQEVFQTYAYYEKDYTNNLCQLQCHEYSHRPFTPACKSDFCKKHTEQKRCHGKLKDCQKIHKTQTYCFAPEDSDRRYEWMLTGSNTSYGSYDVGCEDTINVNEAPSPTYVITTLGAFPMYSDCDTCICTCVSDEKNIDRYFSLKPVHADVDKNMVVTGISFVKNGHILSLQIQQGRLAPNGSIDQSSLEWKNETESADGGVYTVSEDRNTVFLDDILSPSEMNKNQNSVHKDFVVSGVKFEEVDKSLRLAVSFVPYDFESGTIYDYAVPSLQFFGNDKRKDKRVKLSLAESADPIKTYSNLLDSTHQQRVEFQLSGLERDFGQSTIPYIDIQKVVSEPAVPLVGLGLMHKGTKGYGGFLGLKLIQYDYSSYT